MNETGKQGSFVSYVLLVAVYVLFLWGTASLNIGDTPIYVDAILRVLSGGSTRFWDQGGFLSFWEFGHLLWRPLGWLTFKVLRPLLNPDLRTGVTQTLLILNWISGLVAVLSLYAVAFQITQRRWAAAFAAIGFILTNAFLNYAQSGCSYVLGLALLILGFYLLVDVGAQIKASRFKTIAGGLALAGAIGMWFPYFCAIPAALAAPLIVFGPSRPVLRIVVTAMITCALATVLMYGAAMGALGLRSVTEVGQWVKSSSHEVTENRGVTRVLFGIPRALINMGTDSVYFKRYLTRDSYNPVSFFDLATRSLWKIAFAYLFLLALTIGLYVTDRRVLVLFLVNVVPVVAFAFLFAGGVLERYFPMFPMIFVAVACCLSAKEAGRLVRYVPILFILIAGLVNTVALSTPIVGAEREATFARVRELFPLVNENTRVFVAPQDQLWGSAGRLQFEGQTTNNFHVDPVAILGTAQVPQWRKDVAGQIIAAWDAGHDVWISKRLRSSYPKSEWNWTEGEDTRIKWAELPEFFAPLETDASVGGDDGFLKLSPSSTNRDLLSAF
ncbi:MAG TPA: hypothetical protein VFR78_05470 [Pyrinomonadaceae bacterium]|nr:hypothetical protein [Pyrinomonadaceae bacterium]